MKNKEININNRKFWNILKGIGIICVVLGHCSHKFSKYVYLFHLPLFFFVGGYLFSENKYGEKPYDLLVAKLRSNWRKYVLYSLFFLVMHNLFVKTGLVINTDFYSIKNFIINAIDTLLFMGKEQLAGALWFIPLYFVATMIFGVIIYFSNYVSKREKINKHILIIGFSLLSAAIGLYLVSTGSVLFYNFQIGLAVVPFFTIGYYLRNYIDDIQKILKFPLFVISMILLYLAVQHKLLQVDISINIISNYFVFYAAGIIGIYACLYAAKILSMNKYSENIFNECGIYSFEIMAFHILVFKIIDFVINIPKIINHTAIPLEYGVFTHAYNSIWPIYLILGVMLPVLFFRYIKKINKDKIIKILKNKKFQIISIILLIIIVVLPILKLGVMQNDELISRFEAMKGFKSFYSHYFIEQIEKGRALSCVIIPLSMYFGFIGKSTIFFKGMQVISIIICVLLFTKLLKRVFNNRTLNIIFVLLFLSFLPITFEPTAPCVFVTFYNLSLSLLIYSFILFVDYLDTKKTKKFVWSMILFFIVLLTYESFVTYVPIYLLLYLYKNGFKNIFNDKKCIIAPIACGITYILLYFISGKIFPSNYNGNQIGSINIFSSLRVLKTLGYYSLPGSYLTNSKYNYIYNTYYHFNYLDLIRITAFIVLFVVVYFCALYSKEKNTKEITIPSLFKTVFVGLCMIILPFLPLSVADMYQTIGIGDSFLGLPTSFFCYFGSILVVSIVVTRIMQKSKILSIIVLLPLLFVSMNVQKMNNVISNEANKNFRRLENIEEFFNSGIFDNMTGKVYSNDLFITKNALAFNDEYWTKYADLIGLDIEIIKSKEPIGWGTFLEYNYDEEYFILYVNDKKYVISKNNMCSLSQQVNDEEIKIDKKWKVCLEIENRV